MPSSSSSSSCSSSSCSSSCSSSSSYAGFAASRYAVSDTGCLEILGQCENKVVVNSGVGYDGYGNRLLLKDRRTIFLNWAAVSGAFAYLCIRRRAGYRLIDYQDHPVYCLPRATKIDVEVEFYLSEGVIGIDFGGGNFAYYPPLDGNGVIEGLVLGKLYKPDLLPPYLPLDKPNMVPWRSPFLAVRNGAFFPLDGFNTD